MNENGELLHVSEKPVNQEDFRIRCRFEVYNPASVPWSEIRQNILDIEVSAFGAEKGFPIEMLERDFSDPDTVVVYVRDSEKNTIVGFTYAKPTVKTYPKDFPDREASPDTAYIYDTAFEKSYQGKGLLPMLIQKLYEELLRRNFLFVERDSTDNKEHADEKGETYADKVRKNSTGALVREESLNSPYGYGAQVFFRLDLRKLCAQ